VILGIDRIDFEHCVEVRDALMVERIVRKASQNVVAITEEHLSQHENFFRFCINPLQWCNTDVLQTFDLETSQYVG
jgi:hypothetical protein